MQVTLESQTGPGAGRKIVVSAGQEIKVGRHKGASVVIPDDAMLSNLHFALEYDGQTCRVRDLNSRFGTLLNKTKVAEAVVRDGDVLVAGQTTWVVRIEEGAPPVPPAVVPVAVARPVSVLPTPAAAPAWPGPGVVTAHPLLEILQEQPESLYAILDAARDPMIYVLLHGCQEEHESLYEGPKGAELALVAPYLIRLPATSPFLRTLVERGWGKSWGVYLTSAASFAEVRKHLRRFLIVQKATGEQLYFRFYDPRVLRVFLPTCTEEELAQFFGPVSGFLVEQSGTPRLVLFRRQGSKLSVQPLAVGVAAVSSK